MRLITQPRLITNPVGRGPRGGGAVDYVAAIQAASWYADVLSYWPFDDTTGSTARDATGNNRTGAKGAGATINQAGKYGPSWALDGSAGATVLGNAAYLSAFPKLEGTIMLWWKAGSHNATARDQYAARVDASNYVAISASTALNDQRGTYRGAGTTVVATGVADYDPLADWNHVCLTWSMTNTRLRFYRNAGLIVTVGTLTNALTGTIAAAGLLGYATNPPYGWFQHLVLVNRELTAAEIAEAVF